MDIDHLGLVGPARAGALAIAAQFPEAQFTSGRREVADQARAMAGNVAVNRRWIEQTYSASAESRALQAWVNAHPDAKTAAALAAGFVTVMAHWSDEQKARLSKHFSGQAWDLQPMAPGPRATACKAAIRKLPGLTKFLEKEGGLIRWHAQFQ